MQAVQMTDYGYDLSLISTALVAAGFTSVTWKHEHDENQKYCYNYQLGNVANEKEWVHVLALAIADALPGLKEQQQQANVPATEQNLGLVATIHKVEHDGTAWLYYTPAWSSYIAFQQ